MHLRCPPRLRGGLDKTGEFPEKPNRNDAPENETPGALAGATGGDSKAEKRPEGYHGDDVEATWRNAQARHKRAVAAVLVALQRSRTLPVTWEEVPPVLRGSLTMLERLWLAHSSLCALDPPFRDLAFHAAASAEPLPSNIMADARRWAAHASRRERKALCLAFFEALDPADRAAFIDYVGQDRGGAP